MGAKGITIITERTKICPQCGKEFHCPYGIGIGVWNKRIYCGSKCVGLSQRTRIKKNCIYCDKEFETTYKRVKYCSKNCADTDPNAKKRRKGTKNPCFNRIEKECEVCGKKFLVIPARLKSAKCSKECANLWHSANFSGKNSPTWNGGSSFEEYSFDFNNKLKTIIRKRDGEKCYMCGKDQLELGYSLIVHHIDYDKKNSSLDNLISLCRSCHTSTNHNRNKWITYFQNKQEDLWLQ